MIGMESNAPRMPSVIGMNLAQAQAVISVTNANVTIQYRPSDNAAPGTVFHQRPPAGSEVRPGSGVELAVATRHQPAGEAEGTS
jgi:beta-lactam-binding protein with PASTA domain